MYKKVLFQKQDMNEINSSVSIRLRINLKYLSSIIDQITILLYFSGLYRFSDIHFSSLRQSSIFADKFIPSYVQVYYY